MFFNMRDPTLRRSNAPIKKDSLIHANAILGTCIFLCGLVIAILGFKLGLIDLGGPIAIILITYLTYLLLTFCCSALIQYIKNMKRFEEYQNIYQRMVNGQGFLIF